MLHKRSTIFISTLLFLAATVANAHDPALHKKENAEKPNCKGMSDMDHSKMDMNDPVMMAMMKQCMGDNHHGEGNDSMKSHHDGMPKKNAHKDQEHLGEMKKSQ